MKILLQHLGNGRTTLEEVPAPGIQTGHVLIRTTRSVVSPGTERMLVEFGKGNLLQKAQQQPERVRQVLNKMRTDGVLPTIRAVRHKLDQPIPLGYCNAGLVIGVGAGVNGFSIGDRVACNGAHAEVVSVSKNLVTKIFDDVPDEEAAFAPLAAIALHGYRLGSTSVGETVVIIGLGVVGLLAAQWAALAGCLVIGFDVSDTAVERARKLGIAAHNSGTGTAAAIIEAYTNGRGADAVLVCTTTQSREPLDTAAALCRRRGKVVLLGTADIQLNRRTFFDKELQFEVSRSYGPGRYDAAYEKAGQDYPDAYVRWTAGRNIEAAVQLMRPGHSRLQVGELISSRIAFEDAPSWYAGISSDGGLATVFEYTAQSETLRVVQYSSHARAEMSSGIGLLGAGPFVQGTLLPALVATDAVPNIIVSKNGVSAGIAAKKYGIGAAASDHRATLEDPSIGLVVIATPHETHASLVLEALEAGKAVYVEKPLALNRTDLDAIEAVLERTGAFLYVGHNRRFAPLAQKARSLLPAGVPKHIIVTVNAGQATTPEGGRFLGEGGHWVDLCVALAGHSVTSVRGSASIGEDVHAELQLGSNAIAAVHYLTTGAARYEKERIEIHAGGQSLVIRNWRKLQVWNAKGATTSRSAQDKGHTAQMAAVIKAWRAGQAPPVPLEETMNVSRALIAVMESIGTGTWVKV
jgi:predicted dehydrogenase